MAVLTSFSLLLHKHGIAVILLKPVTCCSSAQNPPGPLPFTLREKVLADLTNTDLLAVCARRRLPGDLGAGSSIPSAWGFFPREPPSTCLSDLAQMPAL